MGRPPEPTWANHPARSWLVAVAGASSVGVTAVVDVAVHRMQPAAAALDVGVGAGFLAVGALTVLGRAARAAALAFGASWLLASLVPTGAAPHVLLALLLLLFPGSGGVGGVRRSARGLVLGLAGLTALGVAVWLYGRPAVAVLMSAVAVVRLVRPGDGRGAWRWFPAVAATAVATTSGAAWGLGRWVPEWQSAAAALTTHQVVLLLVALGCGIAARAAVADRSRQVEERLATEVSARDPGGLSALGAVLATALGSPGLRVDPVDRVPTDPESDLSDSFVVSLEGAPVAAVRGDPGLLSVRSTREAVERAVRVVARLEASRREEEAVLAELEGEQRRAVEATAHERAVLAARLAEEVAPSLTAARTALLARGEAPADSALAVAVAELDGADREVAAVVGDVPAVPLGGGRLARALEALADAAPLDVRVDASADAVADRIGETALWFACREGLANAVKHSGAPSVAITVRRVGDRVVAEVTDRGTGGVARVVPGRGLDGLRARLEAAGGAVRVEAVRVEAVDGGRSRGTRLVAEVPAEEAGAPPAVGAAAAPTAVREAAVPGRSRWQHGAAVIGGAVVVVVAIVSIVTATTDGGRAVPGGVPVTLLIWGTTVALTAALVRAVALGRRAMAAALGTVAVGGLLPALAWLPPTPSEAAVRVLAAAPLVVAGVAILGVGEAQEPRRRRATAVSVAAASGAVVVHLLWYSPFDDPGCGVVCEALPPLMVPGPGTGQVLALVAVLTIAAAGAALVATASSDGRSDPLVAVTGGLVVGGLAATSVLHWSGWDGVHREALPTAAAGAVGAAVLVADWRRARARARLVRLVDRLEDLESSPAAARLVGTARFRHLDRWVDADGLDTAAGDRGRQDDEDIRVGADVAAAVDAPERLVLAVAAGLARTRARRRELAAAFAASGVAAARERDRIERDLHDGVQQRLVGVALHLRLTAPNHGDGPLLLAAEAHVQAALHALRELARATGADPGHVPTGDPQPEGETCALSSPTTS